MKRLFVVLFIVILSCAFISAQENLFEKTSITLSKSITEKLERCKTREALKNWEVISLKSEITLSKNFKGKFNIFEKDMEFEITKDFGIDVNGVQGYKAELKEGGYAILSNSVNGIGASIWYEDRFYNVEPVGEGIYFVSETDMDIIRQQENPEDYLSANQTIKVNQLNKNEAKNSSISSTLSSATVTVFVAYTSAVAQNYPSMNDLINQCQTTTNYTFENGLIESAIEIVGSQQLTYTESGDADTDISRFMTNGDGYMDQIHSLRNQYQADVCVLLVNTLNYNGYAGAIGSDFDDAFCVVKANAAVNNYTFPHELGHLFGCRHQSDQGTDPYEYAHGYWWLGRLPYFDFNKKYQTVMSIDPFYIRVPYFSNPYVTDQVSNPMGTEDFNYCAYAIDDYASVLAALEPHYTTSGTMTADEWWSGTINITGDVTVSNGVTLTIASGTTVYTSSGKSIKVDGTLNATNTTFTSSGTSWGGISFRSGSSGTLDGCTISNVTTYGGAAIHITNSSPTIKNCTIEDMSTLSHGITVSNGGSPYLFNNIIRNGGSNGVFVNNANVYMQENEISGFTNSGKAALCVTTYGDALLGRTTYPYSGDNILQNNYYGLYSSAHSEIQAGNSSGGLAINNSFLNNTSNAYAINYSTIYAEKNWWSPNPPARTYKDGTSYLDYTPYNGDQSLSADTKNSSTNIESVNLLIRARDYLRLGLYQEAFLLYQQIITSKTNSNDIQFAIADLYRLYQNYKNSELINFLQLLTDNENSEFRATVLEVLSKLYMREGLENEFLHYNKLLISSYEDTVNEMYGLVDLFYHYFNKSDYEKALQVIESVPLKYCNEDVVLSAKWLAYTALDIESSSYSKTGDAIATLKEEEAANDFILFENYPNPFNPNTIITFSIPQQAEVELYVYDILGRQVAELVNETLSAGKYDVDFNGSKLTSGMYIYKLSAGSFTESKKMLLLK